MTAEIKSIQTKKECPYAKELAKQLTEWAEEGKIAGIACYVVFDDGRGYSDWMADHKINVDVLSGGLASVIHRINQKED